MRLPLLLGTTLALALTGCGDDGGEAAPAAATTAARATTATSSPGSESASPSMSATVLDTCDLLTDSEVLTATTLPKLAFPTKQADIGGILQCEWDPQEPTGNVVRITLAYLSFSPDKASYRLVDAPAEAGLGDHVMEEAEPRDHVLQVVRGDSYLSLSMDDNAQLVQDRRAVARALITKAFARLPA